MLSFSSNLISLLPYATKTMLTCFRFRFGDTSSDVIDTNVIELGIQSVSAQIGRALSTHAVTCRLGEDTHDAHTHTLGVYLEDEGGS